MMTRFRKEALLFIVTIGALFLPQTLAQAQFWYPWYPYYGGYHDDNPDNDWYYDYYDYDTIEDGDPELWDAGYTILREHLRPGRTRSFYRRQLADLGYEVTSVNFNNDGYAEYEVVNGPWTYEIQIDFNEDSGRATQVEVERNLWRAEATERAMERPYQ